MIEILATLTVAGLLSLFTANRTPPDPIRTPGLSSQAAQIKPLSPAAIALGKKAYLGPKRSRPLKRKKT